MALKIRINKKNDKHQKKIICMLPILEYTILLRKLGSKKKTNAVFGAFSGAQGIHGDPGI